jgi:hypothetical protein
MKKSPRETAAVPYAPPPEEARRSRALAVKERHEGELLGLPGVMGVGLTECDGREAIVLYLRSEEARSGLPREMEGVPVTTEITGEITARGD